MSVFTTDELRLEDVLELDVFRSAGAVLVAAPHETGRRVRWAHIADGAEMAPFLSGGELVLASARVLPVGSECVEFVDTLAGVGAAGLVVELTDSLVRVPDELCRRAEARSLPVVAMRRPTRFIEITEQVHGAILDHQHGLIADTDRLMQELTSVLLEGDDLTAVITRASETLRTPLVLEDPIHQVVEHHVTQDPSDEDRYRWILETWHEHSRSPHDVPGQRGGVETTGHCVWHPIRVRGEEWGRLHAFVTDPEGKGIPGQLLARVTAVVGLALLREQSSAALADVARGELLSRLRRGAHRSTESALAEATALGVDLEDRRLAAVSLAWSSEETKAASAVDPQQSASESSLLLQLGAAAERLDCKLLARVEGHRLMAVVGVSPDEASPGAAVEEMVRSAFTELASGLSRPRLRAGISEEATIETVNAALDHAEQAMTFAGRSEGLHAMHHGKLALAGLLALIPEQNGLARYAEQELGPLLEIDARRGSNFVGTLRMFLELNGNRTRVAAALYLRRTSLYKRLARIEEILRCDLDDARTRASLYVALEALTLLERDS